MPKPAVQMTFRVAVRQVEAWLLADRARMASFLGVSQARLPGSPEAVADPKQEIVNIARNSAKRAIREEMVPAPGARRKVGPGYVAQMIDLITRRWRPAAAADRSESLRRSRLDRLAVL